MKKNSYSGPSRSIGVGLRHQEIDELDKLASTLGFSRNAIMAWMIRNALRRIHEGELEIPVIVRKEVTRRLGDP